MSALAKAARLAAAAALLAPTLSAAQIDWDPARRSPKSVLYKQAEAPRYEGTAVRAALAFLGDKADLFTGSAADEAAGVLPRIESFMGLDLPARGDAPAPEAAVSRVDRLGDVTFVRMGQTHEGLPVSGADLVVAVRNDGSISSYLGGYVAGAHDVGVRGFTAPAVLSHADAEAKAAEAVGAELYGDHRNVRQVWWADQDGGLVKAFEVQLEAARPRGDWTVHVHASTGEVLAKQDGIMSFHAHGKVFMTNPLRDDTIVEVELERLDGSGKLIGEFVKVTNGKHAELVAPDGDFIVDRESPHFAEVGGYYHIDKIHQNLNEIDPDFTGMDWRIPLEVHSKGSFFMRNDNAFYSPFKKSMHILDPKKLNDLHLEAGVAYHEYHHAVTDNIVPGLNSTEGRAMHEGYSDYFSSVVTGDPELGEWALAPLNRPHMRDLRSDRTYPDDLHPNREPHSDGEIWGAACWTLRNTIDPATADFLVHRSRFYISTSATFKSAYEGILQADQDFFDGANAEAITQVFTARGIANNDPAEEAPGEHEARAAFRALHH